MKTNKVVYIIEMLNSGNKLEFLDNFYTTKKKALLSLSGWKDMYPDDKFHIATFYRDIGSDM
jgi:hypothetical protein